MVSVVGVISGLDAYVQEKIIRLAPDVFVVDRLGIIQSHRDLIQALKRPLLTWADFERVRNANLPHTAQVSTRAFRSMTVRFGDKHLANVFVVGTTPNFADMFKLRDRHRPLLPRENEDQAAANVAVIGADTRDELFPRLDPLGRTLTLGGLPFRIIGVFARQGKTLGFSRDNLVCVPIQVYRKNFMAAGDSLNLQIQARGGVAGLEASMDEVRALLRRRAPHGLPRPRPVRHPHPGRPAGPLEAGEPGRLRAHAAGVLGEPGGGRDRDHEHHAGERGGAHHRDRHPPGPGRAQAGHRPAVPAGGGRAQPGRRHHRAAAGRRRAPGRCAPWRTSRPGSPRASSSPASPWPPWWGSPRASCPRAGPRTCR